jgi:GT2 family glycosyltransferase/glycosyltransferase involved in cell wall biosynthesis
MAGIGIRYAEFARRLPRPGLEVVLVTAGDPAEARQVPGVPDDVRSFARGGLAALLADCDAAVAQGQLANDLVLEVPELPVAIDLYDPWLIENLHYAPRLGLGPYRNDHASWTLQLSRGDFFLCSSAEQRHYYLGFLTALGRVNPRRLEIDPALDGLIAPVPFGVAAEPPPHRPYLPAREPGERRILFGGLYDWYDPWPLLRALERLDRPSWRVFLVRTPNAATTPQHVWDEVEAWCRARGFWDERVRPLDWVAEDRRYDLLRDVDVLVALHQPGLETSLSLRTRFLEAFATGCPVIVTDGGVIAGLLREHPAGVTVPPGDTDAVARALREVLEGAPPAERAPAARALAARFDWERVLAPLVAFCRAPLRDATKDEFAVRLTPAPAAPARVEAPARRALRHVTVALLSWNGREHLEVCLPALAAQADPGVPWDVVVLDNGSTDDTAGWVRRHHPSVRIVASPRNVGFCAGNNRLVSAIDSDGVAFLNNDTRPAPTWLAALVQALGEAPDDVAAVSGLLTDWDGRLLDCAQGVLTFDGHAFQLGQGQPLDAAPRPKAGAELFLPSGGNMLIRRDAFLEAGGFDEAYFAYYDDVDLGWRLWSGGRRVLHAPEAVAAHRGGATGVRLGQYNRGLLFERNAFRTAYKNYEAGLWEAVMPAVLLTVLARSRALLVRNPGGGLLDVDPYTDTAAEGTAPAAPRRRALPPPVRRVLQRVLGTRADADQAPRIADEHTIAQFRAIGFVLRHLDAAAEQRAAVQARRRRGDREIFERFPPYLVPTYPGDEALFASPGFRSWLPRGLPLVECTLADVMRVAR